MRGVGEKAERRAAAGRPHRVGVGEREHRDVGHAGHRRGLGSELLGAEAQAGEHDEVGMTSSRPRRISTSFVAHALGDRVLVVAAELGRAVAEHDDPMTAGRGVRGDRPRRLRGRSGSSASPRSVGGVAARAADLAARAASVASRSTTSFITSPE